MAAPLFVANVATPAPEDDPHAENEMQPARIRNAALRVLRRGTSRALPLAELSRILADEECITISPDALADSLRVDSGIALLERPDPIEALPLAVHETGAAYREALKGTSGCWAVVDTGERPFADEPDTFELLAAPLLRLWREAEDDRHLRQEVSTALGGLYAMISTLDDASYDAAIDHALTGDGTARET